MKKFLWLNKLGVRKASLPLVSISLGLAAAFAGYCHVASAGGVAKTSGKQATEDIKLGPGEYLPQRIYTVPLICLATTPEKYDGKIIMTSGYVTLDSEYTILWFHKEDADNFLIGNCVALHQATAGKLDIDTEASHKRGPIDPLDKVQKKYCIVEGLFTAKQNGKIQQWGGSISKIQRLQFWSDPDHPRPAGTDK